LIVAVAAKDSGSRCLAKLRRKHPPCPRRYQAALRSGGHVKLSCTPRIVLETGNPGRVCSV